MKISKLFIPGLSGLAQILPALILWLKGYQVKAMRPVDLPSNWISIHPGLKKKVVDSMVDHWKLKIDRFAEGLFQGKRTYWPAFISLPIDLLISPVAVGYYFVGRFFIAKTFFATDKCNDCPVHRDLLRHPLHDALPLLLEADALDNINSVSVLEEVQDS